MTSWSPTAGAMEEPWQEEKNKEKGNEKEKKKEMC
jgi:hypothetical protein